jgi:hypothetical protein
MTVIAYRDGIIAADTGLWLGQITNGQMIKIARRKGGALIGCAGVSAPARTMMTNFLNFQDDLVQPDGVQALIISSNGKLISLHEEHWLEVECLYDAVGAGVEVAIGALAAGASAEEACAIAVKHHSQCNGDIVSLSHKSGRLRRKSAAEIIEKMERARRARRGK